MISGASVLTRVLFDGSDRIKSGPEMFERLPKHSRQCVFWEVEPATPAPSRDSAASSTREAWISGLLLEWGTCGQLATESTTGHVVGAAFYAPPDGCHGHTTFPPPR